MSLNRWLAAGAVAALAVAASPAAAQDWKGFGRLEGRVLDPDGNGIPDAAVKLVLPSRGGGGPAIKTDKKGKWAVLGLAAGQWNVDIEAAGFATKQISINLGSESQRVPPIEVKLERAAPKGPPPEVLEAMQKGDDAFKAGRYAEARGHYERLMQLRPELATSAVIHKQIAFTYSQEGNHAKALEHLDKVLAAEPDNQEIKTLTALVALEAGEMERGLKMLETLAAGAIQNPEVYYNVGVKFRNMNKQDEAIQYFTKTLGVDPTYVDAYMQRGLSYLGLQKIAEAKADFKKVVELQPEGAQSELAKKALEQLK